MLKRYSNKEAVQIVISAARLYQKNFVGKRILFIAIDKHKNVVSLEAGFDVSNFQHLTGLLATNDLWSPTYFYNVCISGRLSEKDICFSDNGTTHQKLAVLKQAFQNSNLSAKMIGNFNHSYPLLYTDKLVGGTKWAIGFKDIGGNGNYIPNTLLQGDIRNSVHDAHRIIATYIKGVSEKYFKTCIYKVNNIDFGKLKYPDDWGELPKL